jgi:hypothetical protein
MPPVPCILGCEDPTLLKSRKEHKLHVEYACPMALVECRKCNTKTQRRNFTNHDCLEGFIVRAGGQDNDSIISALREMK